MSCIPAPEPIDAEEADYLFVQSSSIPSAGAGLFTAIPIHRGEIIAVFQGDLLSPAEAKERASTAKDAYFVSLLDGSTMDSMHTECFAKYANDAEGPGGSRLRNNAVITLNDEDEPCLVATRTIKAGGEVFVSYGKDYWAARKKTEV